MLAGVGFLEPAPAHRMGTALSAVRNREGDGLVACDAPLTEGWHDRAAFQNLVPNYLFYVSCVSQGKSPAKSVVDPREVQVGPFAATMFPFGRLSARTASMSDSLPFVTFMKSGK